MRKGETKADRQRRVAWVLAVTAEEGDGCREWPWSRSPKGYGDFYWDGRVQRVGHIVLELSGHPRPAGAHQLHSCDNPACAAPWHLRWGTNAENRQESIARGRHFTKLTPDQVLDIYHRRGDTQRSLAAEYGVTQRVVWQIKHGHTWAHVTGHREAS